MNPPQQQQILLHAVIKHDLLVLRLTCIRRTLLIRDQETPHKQRIVDRSAAQHTAHFQPATCIVRCNVEEFLAQVFRNEEGAYWIAVLEVCAWFKGETLFFGECWGGVEGFFAGDFGTRGLG